MQCSTGGIIPGTGINTRYRYVPGGDKKKEEEEEEEEKEKKKRRRCKEGQRNKKQAHFHDDVNDVFTS